MSKHTPGPWHWDSDPIKGDPLGRVRYRVVAKGRTITQCYYSSGDDQSLVDTRLIAAAPELLEVLQGVLQIDRGTSGRIIIEGWQEEVIRAAIAKATGEHHDN